MRKLLFIAFFLLLFLSASKKVYAAIIFQDNFDSGSANQWTPIHGPNLWQVNNNRYGALVTTSSTILDSVAGNITTPNYSIDLDISPIQGEDKNIDLRWTNNNNRYEVHFNNGGANGFGKLVNYHLQNGTTYHIKVILDNQHIQFYVNSDKLFDETDSSYTFGPNEQIGLRVGTGASFLSEVYFDNIVVSTLDSVDMNVPTLKQTDSPWGTQNYDTATLWTESNSTIGRWGCALTSAAMVLQYYGITKLIDGTGLDPGTLNTWLNSQPDGYIGQGLINWIAISRLSALAKASGNNPGFNFDALEFQRASSGATLQLTSDINIAQPDILEEPGHFVVAKGLNGSSFDINDPYFSRTVLTDTYNNSFLSLVRFIPTFSNLSYIMFTLDTNQNIILTNAGGQRVGSDGSTTYTEIANSDYYIQTGMIDPVTGVVSPSKRILSVPKPTDGTYTISFPTTSTGIASVSATLFSYTNGGAVVPFSLSGFSKNDEPATFTFSYQQGTLAVAGWLVDTTPPQMLSAKTLDTDNNGKIDRVQVKFVRDINGPSVNASGTDFLVNNYSATATAKTANATVNITVTEKAANDTGATPLVTLRGDGTHASSLGIKDAVSGTWNHQQTITPTDGAIPTTPTVDIPSGDYFSPQSINLTSFDNPNTPSIYYTLDESDPATSSSRILFSSGSAVLINDDYTLKAIAYDPANNSSNQLLQTYGIAPAIDDSSIVATTSGTTVTISWNTDRNSKSRVIFGKKSKANVVLGAGGNYGYDSASSEDTTKVISHTIVLANLDPGATYYYRVISRGSPEQVSNEKSIAIPASLAAASASSQSNNNSSGSSGGTNSGNSSPSVCTDQKPKSAPVLLSAFPGLNTVTLIWSEGSDPISYYLVGYGNKSGQLLYGNPNIGGKGTTSYIVNNLSGGQTYYFRVRAGNNCMPGDFSNEIAATPFGFAETGLAGGFQNGVLGATTENTNNNLIPKALAAGNEKKVLGVKIKPVKLSGGQENWVKIGILVAFLLLLTGIYWKRFR